MARLGLGLPVCDLLLSRKQTSLSGLTSALSQELGQFQIRVNALVPGYIQTQMIESKLMASTFSEMASMCPPPPFFFWPLFFCFQCSAHVHPWPLARALLKVPCYRRV